MGKDSDIKCNTIIIADEDSKVRYMLRETFENKYDVKECDNGLECIEIMKQHQDSIVLVLLDVQIPLVSGIEVMKRIYQDKILNTIPVVLMTSDCQGENIQEGYNLGAVDIIQKPLQIAITQNRVENIIAWSHQKNHLEDLVERQTTLLKKQNKQYKQRNDAMMTILKDIITNRSVESENHIRYVEGYSHILAQTYHKLFPKSKLTNKKVELITQAAKFHDLGKITMPELLIKRQGRLLPAEMEYLKEHTLRGGEIVHSMSDFQDPHFIRICYNICLYHHEKCDGTGYPFGLQGEDIPIEAQIVAVADMFDALVNNRKNKDAIPGKSAVTMLLTGACGELSQQMQDCINEARDELIQYKIEN